MVNYAKEYGIDLEKLKEEDPTHPKQMRLRREIEAKSADMWAHVEKVNELSRIGIEHARKQYEFAIKNPPAPVTRKRLPKVANQKQKPPKPKTVKVGNYNFTERQFQLAMEALEKQNQQKQANS